MSEYWYIEEANYILYCLLCPIPISSLKEKPGWKFGYQEDIIDIIVDVHFILYTSESMCCRAITFTFSILQSWQWEGQSGLKDIRQCETLMGEWCLSDVGWLPTCERLLTRFALAAFDDRWCQTHHLFAWESSHNRIFPFHYEEHGWKPVGAYKSEEAAFNEPIHLS